MSERHWPSPALAKGVLALLGAAILAVKQLAGDTYAYAGQSLGPALSVGARLVA